MLEKWIETAVRHGTYSRDAKVNAADEDAAANPDQAEHST
jgi:hypothetical protein